MAGDAQNPSNGRFLEQADASLADRAAAPELPLNDLVRPNDRYRMRHAERRATCDRVARQNASGLVPLRRLGPPHLRIAGLGRMAHRHHWPISRILMLVAHRRMVGEQGCNMGNRRAWSKGLTVALLLGALLVAPSTADAAAPAKALIVPASLTVPASVSARTVDPGKVRDCVNLIQFGAYTHNAKFVALWNQADGDVTKLRAVCESLGRINPVGLDALSKQWHDTQKWLAAAAANANRKAPKTPKSPPATRSGSCAGGYINVDGNCIASPSKAPSAAQGATARCNDGTYSHSQHHQGTCSSHGGVAAWL